MQNQDITEGFQHVDQSQTGFLIKFLEDVHRCETVQEGFAKQLAWLNIQPGQHVLDVGCGIGDQAFAMAKLTGKTGSVTGTDISTAMITMAQHRHAMTHLPLQVLVAPAARQPFAEDSFDIIRTERVLMYLKNIEEVFVEYTRLLKPGGKLLIFDVDWDALVLPHPDKELTRSIVEFISDSFPSGRIGAELFCHFKDSGFKDIQIRPHGYMHNLELTKRIIGGIISTGVDHNVFTNDEVNGWWAELERADAAGQFFSCFQGFIVMGTRN
ncbi:methyltransferase domain-containing protein [Mucilaginibacter flavidus]|uniref:methyltransferase domain-containing protein n=1 Tax=Mucilaginibacter flavidus TaxID=2949309 RepID=UPI00209387EC|nr:methyltransferase domain-containing protein [Mucilaginibacter flavidus]MCO5949108.1 methyltransferase domain-containing protein [Mucilaginibacter flavidus]